MKPIDGDKLVAWLKEVQRRTVSAHQGAYSYIIGEIEDGKFTAPPVSGETSLRQPSAYKDVPTTTTNGTEYVMGENAEQLLREISQAFLKGSSTYEVLKIIDKVEACLAAQGNAEQRCPKCGKLNRTREEYGIPYCQCPPHGDTAAPAPVAERDFSPEEALGETYKRGEKGFVQMKSFSNQHLNCYVEWWIDERRVFGEGDTFRAALADADTAATAKDAKGDEK